MFYLSQVSADFSRVTKIHDDTVSVNERRESVQECHGSSGCYLSHILVSLKLVRTMKAGCGTSEQTSSRETSATQEDGTRNYIPIKTPAAIPPSNPVRVSRVHQDLHKELLLAHKKGLCVTSKSELQLVLERRKKEQTQREEGELGRSPLEKEMLKRQQRHQQLESVQAKGGTENHYEFVVVKENLRKTSKGEQGPFAPAL